MVKTFKYNKSIRFVILFLSISFCISGTGCVMPPMGEPVVTASSRGAGIQPLPENHGSWSKEEVDTIIEAITTTAKHYGLEEKKTDATADVYELSNKRSELTIKAYYNYIDHHGLHHRFRLTSKSPRAKGTIRLGIWGISFGDADVTQSVYILVEKMGHELFDPLRNKFGERMEVGQLKKIYELEP